MALQAAANAAASKLVVFPLLASPETYNPNTFDYSPPADSNLPKRAEWIEVFRRSTPEFTNRAAADASVPDAKRLSEEFQTRWLQALAALEAVPSVGAHEVAADSLPIPRRPHLPPPKRRFPRCSLSFASAYTLPEPPPAEKLACLLLCDIRERLLRDLGFNDCFLTVKAEANAAALKLLPGLIAELDSITDDRERLSALIQGAFAGNIFDLGAPATQEMFAAGGVDFRSTRAKLQERPWTVDDFDALWARWSVRPYRSALLFVDNSGADVVLGAPPALAGRHPRLAPLLAQHSARLFASIGGMLPLARELLRRGARVIIAANEVPTINDITFPEAVGVVATAVEGDAIIREGLADGRLLVMSSGNDLPVIDLRRVSAELAEKAAGCDLVVLEGMGRGIETNLRTQLTSADCLNLGMIKHQEVATTLEGPMYGCVCRFQRALAEM